MPRVTYSHAFYSSENHTQFYQFDEIDMLDKLEYLELAVATYLLGRREGSRPGDAEAFVDYAAARLSTSSVSLPASSV